MGRGPFVIQITQVEVAVPFTGDWSISDLEKLVGFGSTSFDFGVCFISCRQRYGSLEGSATEQNQDLSGSTLPYPVDHGA